MLFCSVLAVVVVGIITTMTAKVTNGVGTTAAMMPSDLLAQNGPTKNNQLWVVDDSIQPIGGRGGGGNNDNVQHDVNNEDNMMDDIKYCCLGEGGERWWWRWATDD